METIRSFFKNSREIGEKFFYLKDYTPIPFLFLAFLFESPKVTGVALGCLFIVFGQLIRVYSIAFLGGTSRQSSEGFSPRLVTEGAFALVRNPLYVGNLFMIFGINLFAGLNWLMFFSMGFFIFQYYLVAQYEESLLEEQFGEEFFLYKDAVPAWVPNQLPNLDEMQWPASFSPALRHEKKMWVGVSVVLLLLLLRA